MVLLVPFDGSALSTTALARAREIGAALEESVLVLSVVPDDEAYARERGWVDDGFDQAAVADDLEARAREVAPDATFRWERPADVSSIASTTTDIARTIRGIAAEVDARIVFVGSENAGRVAAPVSSVGRPVSDDPRYDVFIVRHAEETAG